MDQIKDLMLFLSSETEINLVTQDSNCSQKEGENKGRIRPISVCTTSTYTRNKVISSGSVFSYFKI
ncbi:hypothetical protein ACHAWC_003807 [Mediolabrus comicus]